MGVPRCLHFHYTHTQICMHICTQEPLHNMHAANSQRTGGTHVPDRIEEDKRKTHGVQPYMHTDTHTTQIHTRAIVCTFLTIPPPEVLYYLLSAQLQLQ